MAAAIKISVDGGEVTIPLAAKEFKTGSRGYSGLTKLVALDGKRYQVVVNAIEIGSKPKQAVSVEDDNMSTETARV